MLAGEIKMKMEQVKGVEEAAKADQSDGCGDKDDHMVKGLCVKASIMKLTACHMARRWQGWKRQAQGKVGDRVGGNGGRRRGGDG